MLPFFRKSTTCSAAITAQFTSASLVLAPICGNKITSPELFALCDNSIDGKSVTKALNVSFCRASITSLLLTMPPLERLMSFDPRLKCSNKSFEMRSFVLSTRGT